MKKRSTKVCFIVNPAAGKKESVRQIDWLNREATKRWVSFEIAITRDAGSTREMASRKAAEFDMVVACGGDGTVNQVINGIVGYRVIFGVLPIGTGNDFARSLKVDRPLTEALDLLYRENVKPIDLIHCSGDVDQWCANTIGFGFDGLANFYSKKVKIFSGSMVYVIGALRALFRFKGAGMELDLDGNIYQDRYMMVTLCNGKWEGGQFHLAPDAELTDGKFDLVVIRKVSILTMLAYLPAFIKGPRKWMKHFDTKQGEHLSLVSDRPLNVHIDGEYLGNDIRNVKLHLVKGAIKAVTGY